MTVQLRKRSLKAAHQTVLLMIQPSSPPPPLQQEMIPTKDHWSNSNTKLPLTLELH